MQILLFLKTVYVLGNPGESAVLRLQDDGTLQIQSSSFTEDELKAILKPEGYVL